VQTHGPICDSQPKPNASGLAIASIVYPVKRSKDFPECVFRDSGAVIANSDRCNIRAPHFNFNFGSFSSVLHSIADHVSMARRSDSLSWLSAPKAITEPKPAIPAISRIIRREMIFSPFVTPEIEAVS
jgi:hypothetical protein